MRPKTKRPREQKCLHAARMRIGLDQFIRTTAAAQCNMRYNKRRA
jgi:hypothetical protein